MLAVVARGMGKPCVSGAGAIRVRLCQRRHDRRRAALSRRRHADRGRRAGQVIRGDVDMLQAELSGEFAILIEWADGVRRMGVRANAETPQDARVARKFGAEGIGLCRTEHMFFEGDRIVAVREMILADDEAGRRAALAKLLPIQRADFVELFEIMSGLPVTIRLLDPPLHEFLPQREAEIADVATVIGVAAREASSAAWRNCARSIRCSAFAAAGSRSPIPEIAEMQARAIFEGGGRGQEARPAASFGRKSWRRSSSPRPSSI